MLYSELRNYLLNASSQEVVDMFDAAVKVFDRYGLEDYLDVFDQSSFDFPDSNDMGVVDYLQSNLRSMLEHLINGQGLQFHEYVLTSQLVEIADGLLDLLDYEDQATVWAYLALEETDHEVAGQLLSLVTPWGTDELMGMLEEVRPSFASILKDRLALVNEEEEVLADHERQIQLYSRFKGMILQGSQLYADQLIQQPSTIGLPFADYVNLYQIHTQGVDFGREEPTNLAKELVALAYLSQDGVDNPLIVIRKHLGALFTDQALLTRVDIAVSRLTVEVAHAQA